MKKVLIALLSVLFLTTFALGQTEILVNGDLEAWTDVNTPTGWHHIENITQDADSVHGGTYSAKHVGGTKDFGQYVPVTPGYTYDISIWYKVVESDGDDARIWSVWRSEGASDYTYNGDELRGPENGYLDNNGGAWTEYTTSVVAPDNADTLYFELRTYSGAITYWDDLSIVETAPPEDPFDYFIPKGSHEKGWATLREAVDSINANGVVGEINLLLDADTLRDSSFTFNAALDADNNVTVKPAEGRDVVLIVEPGASEGNGPQMIGFETGYVTFDGSNDGTDSRNLIVTTEGDADVPFGLNSPDADYVTIKNLIIKNLDNGAINFRYGVVINDVSGQEDLIIENCQIASPEFPVRRYGVAVWGDWNYAMPDVSVLKCEINAGAGCIEDYLGGVCVFNDNTLNLYPSATPHNYGYGIRLSYGHDTEIRNNVFNLNIEKTEVANSRVYGIKTYSNPVGAVFTVENNMFNIGTAYETLQVSVSEVGSSNNARNWNIDHNTFVLNDNLNTSACNVIGHMGGGLVVVDLKNNILINKHTGSTASSAISLGSNATLTSDQNIIVSDQNCVSYHGTSYANLADWQGFGQDVNSDSLDVTFVSATDLHLAAPSDTDLDLVMPAVGVMEDIDGDMRGTFWAYAGADEGTAYPASNDLDLTFDDATDVANWTTTGPASTLRIWEADSTLLLRDGGYVALVERPVKATIGSVYKLSVDIKTNLWEGEGNNLDLSIQGLGNDDVKTSIISEGDWTTFTLIGIAEAEDGYIRIEGYKAGLVDSTWVDNVVWDDQYLDVIPSSDIASLRAVALDEIVAGKAVVTANTIGAPIFAQDATAGIALYDWDFINDGIVEEGDEILFVGTRKQYNGLQQVSYTDEDYVVLSKGNTIEPALITVPDLDGRDYQGMLVMIEDVDTADGFSWPADGNDASITLTDGTNEFTCRIDKDGEMDGATPPASWPLDLVGVVSEFYSPQIMPRYMDDFICNQAPMAFTILNPADDAVITSFDDPEVEYIEVDGDSVYAMFVNWTDADDPEGDSLTYEMLFIGEGPDETVTTADTFIYIPLDQEEPYNMNGTYTYYFTATDPMGEMSVSDTHDVTFDFPAPPMIVDAQVVLVDGTPKYYVEFDLPLDEPEIANFSIYDLSEEAAITPTAVDSIAPNAVLISGDLPEDHMLQLYTDGLTAPGATVTVPDTSYGNRVIIPFSAAHPEDEAKMLENFETDKGLFQTLTYSGSTGGILTTSTFDASADAAYIGDKSGKMVLLDDPAVNGGWFVRIPYDYPSYNTVVKANSVLMFVLKGTAADVNITLTIKDTGYERAMWKNVTLCENDWQVVAFDLANDPVEGWITGDGTVTGETVKIADIHISCDTDEDVTLYIDGFTERQVLSPVDITLNVIMKKWVEEGWFNLAMDYVDVAGTFNEWDGTDDIASDFDGDTTYTVTVPMMPYGTEYFKFRINGSWDDGKHEFDHGGPARELVVPATASEFTFWFNDDTLEVAAEGIPTEFALHQNYPNPFNPTTTINFDLPEIADVKLIIYDITGRKVRTLVNNSGVAAGYKKIVWNGRDDFGNGVATGMYIYRLIAGDFVEVKKMTFLK